MLRLLWKRGGASRGIGRVIFDRLDRLMSVWKTGSDIVKLNAAAGERPVPVSRDTLSVLLTARQVSEWTNGKFDITFGALSDVWKFDQDQDDTIPSPEAIAARVRLVVDAWGDGSP